MDGDEFCHNFVTEWEVRRRALNQKPEPPPPAFIDGQQVFGPENRLVNSAEKSARAQKKWGLVRNDVSKVSAGAKAEAKGLKGLDSGYNFEAMDPHHRMAPLLDIMYAKVFVKKTPKEMHGQGSIFFDWLEGFQKEAPVDYRNWLLSNGGDRFPDSAVDGFVNGGVAYHETEAARRSSRLRFMNGKLYKMIDQPFDTTTLWTAHSKDGWAIYVVSPHGQWYAGSHIVGQYHHSTFLGGRPILSAGEMKVAAGVPLVLTAKSGHYKPGKEEFLRGIQSLLQAGVNLDGTKVGVTNIATKKPVELGAKEFLNSSALQAAHSIW